MPEIEREKEGIGGKSERERRVLLQRGSHRPAVQCMAEAHHSANYDQAFPRRHSSAGNGKSLFSHTPMEAMGHGAMQMRCLYTHTLEHRHTNTSECAALLTLHARSVLTPTQKVDSCIQSQEHTKTHKRTHNQQSHSSIPFMHVASHLYGFSHIHFYLSPSLMMMQCQINT